MKRFLIAASVLSLIAGAAGGAAAKDHGRWDDRGGPAWDNHSGRHDNGKHLGQYKHWRQGERMDRAYWDRGHRIDYRRYHLRAPPRGYEWRQVDDSYVLAAVATGLIASVLAAH